MFEYILHIQYPRILNPVCCVCSRLQYN